MPFVMGPFGPIITSDTQPLRDGYTEMENSPSAETTAASMQAFNDMLYAKNDDPLNQRIGVSYVTDPITGNAVEQWAPDSLLGPGTSAPFLSGQDEPKMYSNESLNEFRDVYPGRDVEKYQNADFVSGWESFDGSFDDYVADWSTKNGLGAATNATDTTKTSTTTGVGTAPGVTSGMANSNLATAVSNEANGNSTKNKMF